MVPLAGGVLPLFYFPPISYFGQLASQAHVWLDPHQRYDKQTYRNRCFLAGPNGVQRLVVPVKHLGRPKSVAECELDYSRKWVNEHVGAIKAAYGKAPFFLYYADAFFDILHGKPQTLAQLNLAILTQCLNLMRLPTLVQVLESRPDERPAPVVYLPVSDTRTTQTNRPPQSFPIYQQVFGKDFEADLCILDLLFCMGPPASEYVRNLSAAVQ